MLMPNEEAQNNPSQDNPTQSNPTQDHSAVVEYPLFERGELIRHKRYGYRGVIVDFDQTCQASEEWHQATQTKPDRSQPWYHVLVHDSTHTTYAAQSNLEPDPNPAPINHPLLAFFFSSFQNEKYVRNDTPWPES